MKFSLSWLKEHLETEKSLEEILHWLTMVGLEVEGVEDRAALLKEFVVGHVLQAKPHPDADRLQVLEVENGTETLEVVCGAPNARAGMKGIFAANGSYIPGIDLTLKTTKIRGVTSNGMMLSEREIGLSDEHDGIIEVAKGAEIGSSAAEALGLTDPIAVICTLPDGAFSGHRLAVADGLHNVQKITFAGALMQPQYGLRSGLGLSSSWYLIFVFLYNGVTGCAYCPLGHTAELPFKI